MNLSSMSKTLHIGVLLLITPFAITSLEASANFSDPSEILCLDNGRQDVKICRNYNQGFNSDSLEKNENILLSNSLITETEKRSTPTELINYVKLPESSDLLTNLLSIFAIIISVGVPLWQRGTQKSDANTQREDNINEGYWIREVIMPKINASIFEIYTEYKSICSDTPQDYSTNYKKKVLPKTNELRDLFKLLTVFPKISQSATQLNNICDIFDDAIADNETETKEIRKEGLNRFHIDMTKELMLTHKKSL